MNVVSSIGDVYHWHHSIRPAIGPELFAAAAERLLLDTGRQTVAKWFGFPLFLTFLPTGLGTDLLAGSCNCRNTHTVVQLFSTCHGLPISVTSLVLAVSS